MRKTSVFIAVAVVAALVGCDRGGEPSADEKTKKKTQGAESPKGEQADGESTEEAESESPAIAEYDASALPEKLASEQVIERGLAWSDAGGEHRLVFERRETTETKDGKPEMTTIRMSATHWRKSEGGEWQRATRTNASVQHCKADAGIRTYLGPWSVADPDEDDKKEATFAWSYGCRSDMSPLAHVVYVLDGSKKWVLRGKTAISGPDEEHVPGEVTSASGFDGAPEPLRVHADKVWSETSNERTAAKYQ